MESVKRSGINAEGVRQFQPRVTPWAKELICLKTLKVLASYFEFGHVSFLFANPFRVAGDGHHVPPGCYPGLKLANAFGVVPEGRAKS
jgi:hypothetical protein